MKHKKIYIVLCIIISAVLLYQSVFFLKTLINAGGGKIFYPSYLQLIILLLGITGTVIFAVSQFRRNSLFRLMCSINIMILPLNVWYFKTVMFADNAAFNFGPVVYISFAVTMINVITSCIALALLTNERRIKLSVTQIAGEIIAEFGPALLWKRVTNYCIDWMMIFYLSYNFESIRRVIKVINANDFNLLRSSSLDTQGIQLLVLCMSFLYYLVFETLFATTPGKCITNTVIVNNSGNTAGVLQLVGRTLCRFIPFDAFSFFRQNKMGWHDTLTNTYVTDSELRSQRKKTERDPKDLLYVEELEITE